MPTPRKELGFRSKLLPGCCGISCLASGSAVGESYAKLMLPYKILKNKDLRKTVSKHGYEANCWNDLGLGPASIVKEQVEQQQHFGCYLYILAAASSFN